MNAPIDWLLAGEPYIEYGTRRNLLNEDERDPRVAAARERMMTSPQVRALVTELGNWPGVVISSHKSAGQPFHKLTFLTDLGLKAGDPGVEPIITAILAHQSPEGPFQLPMNTPEPYGGATHDTWAWALCDAPLIVYALAKFGLADHPAVGAAVAHLVGLVQANGWPCAVSKELGNWRGPGRKEDPCPFANLAMLKALAEFEDLRDSPATRAGAETLLSLWAESTTRHPYIFYMGNDFRKIKAPFVWYDLLHMLDVLTRFPWLKEDARLVDMIAWLSNKADQQGRFTPESVWAAWKDWEFGQKKIPSRWLTMLAWRIIGRI